MMKEFINTIKALPNKIKKAFLFSQILLFPLICDAQGEFNNWYFGEAPNAVGVTFNSGFPLPLPGGNLYAHCVTISVSDSVGNLLFFADETFVHNRNMTVMPNGTGIDGEAVTDNQPVLAVQKLDDDSSYFLFTVGTYYLLVGRTKGLEYSIVNMRLDGGLGDIEPGIKNIPIPGAGTSWCAVTGCRHSNNKDVWIVTTLTSLDSLFYTSYLISVCPYSPSFC
jgi:hypothetical protein